MSIPHLDFSCTACDYNSTSLSLTGRRYYQHNEQLLHAECQTGWCFSCCSLVPIEVVPEQKNLQQKQMEVAELRKKFEKMENLPKIKLTWLQQLMGHKNKHEESSLFDPFLRSRIERIEEEIASLIVLLELFKSRTSPMKCLACGGIKHLYLGSNEWSRFYSLKNPEPIGFKHPFCAGELLARCSEIRFHIKPKKFIYDLDGCFIGKLPND